MDEIDITEGLASLKKEDRNPPLAIDENATNSDFLKAFYEAKVKAIKKAKEKDSSTNDFDKRIQVKAADLTPIKEPDKTTPEAHTINKDDDNVR